MDSDDSSSSSDSSSDLDIITGNYFHFVPMLMMLLLEQAKNLQAKKTRQKRADYQRVDWDEYWQTHQNDPKFERELHMTSQSFLRLVEMLRGNLQSDENMARRRGGLITPEMMVWGTIRHVVGGYYIDIISFLGISRASLYRIISRTKNAIINCSEALALLISNGYEISNFSCSIRETK